MSKPVQVMYRALVRRHTESVMDGDSKLPTPATIQVNRGSQLTKVQWHNGDYAQDYLRKFEIFEPHIIHEGSEWVRDNANP